MVGVVVVGPVTPMVVPVPAGGVVPVPAGGVTTVGPVEEPAELKSADMTTTSATSANWANFILELVPYLSWREPFDALSRCRSLEDLL